MDVLALVISVTSLTIVILHMVLSQDLQGEVIAAQS